jgi:hypothetical protein
MPFRVLTFERLSFAGHSGPSQPRLILHGITLTLWTTLPCRAAPLAAGNWHHSSMILSRMLKSQFLFLLACLLLLLLSRSSSQRPACWRRTVRTKWTNTAMRTTAPSPGQRYRYGNRNFGRGISLAKRRFRSLTLLC